VGKIVNSDFRLLPDGNFKYLSAKAFLVGETKANCVSRQLAFCGKVDFLTKISRVVFGSLIIKNVALHCGSNNLPCIIKPFTFGKPSLF
jgi:hypothetical protein